MPEETLTGFRRATFAELLDTARRAYAVRFPGGDGLLPEGVLPRLAEKDAAELFGLYGYLAHIENQTHPLSATGWSLEGWGQMLGVARREATFAAGLVTVTGIDGAGVPSGARLRTAAGIEYQVGAGATISGGTATLAVAALAAGTAGNALDGLPLSFASPIAGIAAQAVVAKGGIVGGAEREPDGRSGIVEGYRARILWRLAHPPAGGTADDYVSWALEVEGVTRAWVRPKAFGLGTVAVYVMLDEVRAAQQGIPQGTPVPDPTGDLALVQDHIDGHLHAVTGDPSGRPIGAEVFVLAPAPVPLDVAISGLVPDTPEIRAAVAASLSGMLRAKGEPGVTLSRSWVAEAVSLAIGEGRHVLAAPVADIEHGAGEIPVLGTVSYG